MAKSTIAAIVVLFNPTNIEINTAKEMSSIFDHLFVFDNSYARCNAFDNVTNCEYYHDGENHGLAYAYNYAINKCITMGVDWLALFDQDSQIINIDKIIDYLPYANNKEAIVCPFISYNEQDSLPRNSSDYLEWTINSGSFLNIDVLKQHDIRYDEYYFLDRLDRDFCKQIKNKGYRIKRINDSVLLQTLGERINGLNLHSPKRNYYIARNRLYYNNKFYPLPKALVLDVAQTIKHVFTIIKGKYRVNSSFKMIIKGILDYLFNSH